MACGLLDQKKRRREQGDSDSVDSGREVTYAVSVVDRDDEIWVLKLDSAVRLDNEVKWLHWTDSVAARIC